MINPDNVWAKDCDLCKKYILRKNGDFVHGRAIEYKNGKGPNCKRCKKVLWTPENEKIYNEYKRAELTGYTEDQKKDCDFILKCIALNEAEKKCFEYNQNKIIRGMLGQ